MPGFALKMRLYRSLVAAVTNHCCNKVTANSVPSNNRNLTTLQLWMPEAQHGSHLAKTKEWSGRYPVQRLEEECSLALSSFQKELTLQTTLTSVSIVTVTSPSLTLTVLSLLPAFTYKNACL